MKKSYTLLLITILSFLLLTTGCSVKKEPSIYADSSQWVYCENDVSEKKVDVFFVCPTVYYGDEEQLNWEEYDETTQDSYIGAINMEKGIYDDEARFFAPYYHQAAMMAYYQDSMLPFEEAYRDIKEAFSYYLETYNNKRPLILAGFSQGAEMVIRLLKDYCNDKSFNKLLIACYAIGWRFTEAEQEQYPNIHFATGEADTGVLITFDCEDPSVTDTIIIPEGTKTLSINPLNWTTGSTVADKSLNLGACFMNSVGEITKEIPQLTGAYIDETRGALKMTDINMEDYQSSLFGPGIYHTNDYKFFYRNLEHNVQIRIASYQNAH